MTWISGDPEGCRSPNSDSSGHRGAVHNIRIKHGCPKDRMGPCAIRWGGRGVVPCCILAFGAITTNMVLRHGLSQGLHRGPSEAMWVQGRGARCSQTRKGCPCLLLVQEKPVRVPPGMMGAGKVTTVRAPSEKVATGQQS